MLIYGSCNVKKSDLIGAGSQRGSHGVAARSLTDTLDAVSGLGVAFAAIDLR